MNGAVLSREAWRNWLALGLFALGVAGIGMLVHHVGSARVVDAARAVAPWLPLVLLLEALRIALEAWSTRLLYRADKHELPWAPLLTAQLMSYPLVLLVPAGRAAGEGLKATLLRRFVGLERAAATAVMNQALPLFGTFLVSLPCVVAAFVSWGSHPFSFAVALQMGTAVALALAIVAGARRPELGRALRRVSERVGARTEDVQVAFRRLGWLPSAPLGLAVLGRLVLAVELWVLASAVTGGMGAVDALLLLGAHLVGAAAGDLIPAQMGATDGAFALAAELLGVTAFGAVGIAIALHAVQLSWALVGTFAALVWRRGASHSGK